MSNNFNCNQKCLNGGQCSNLVEKSIVKELQSRYKAMSDNEKRHFLISNVFWTKPSETGHRSYEYHVRWSSFDQIVCKTFFYHSIDSNDGKLQYLVQKMGSNSAESGPQIKVPQSRKGYNLKGWSAKRKSKNFMAALTTYLTEVDPKHSHYKRKHTPNRRFIFGTTVKRLYKKFAKKAGFKALYKTNSESIIKSNECTYSYFANCLRKQNISVKPELKDMCQKCLLHFNHHQNNKPHAKLKLTNECECTDSGCLTCISFQDHLKDAQLSRDLMRQAASLMNSSLHPITKRPRILALSLDAQKAIQFPKYSLKDTYRSDRMSLINQSYVTLGKDGSSNCYLFSENDVPLPGVSSQYLSIFVRFCVSRACESANSVMIFLDNCCSQNKNQLFLSWLVLIANDTRFLPKNLRVTYLTSGHTFMSADSTHAAIEKKLSRSKYKTEEELVSLIEGAKVNNYVEKLSFGNFLEFFKPFDNFPFLVSKVKVVKAVKGERFLYVKEKYDSPFIKYDILSRSVRDRMNACRKDNRSIFHELKTLDRPNGVDETKVKKIQKALALSDPNCPAINEFNKYL